MGMNHFQAEFAPAFSLADHLRTGEMIDLQIGTGLGQVEARTDRNSAFYFVNNPDTGIGNSVFVVLPDEDSFVAPVKIVGQNLELTLTPVSGFGKLLVRRGATGSVEDIVLDADKGKLATVRTGDSYSYAKGIAESAIETPPFIVRDDSSRTFEESDERRSYDNFLNFLTKYNAGRLADW